MSYQSWTSYLEVKVYDAPITGPHGNWLLINNLTIIQLKYDINLPIDMTTQEKIPQLVMINYTKNL